MQKLLTTCIAGATVAVTGCSSVEKVGSAIPDAMENWAIMYRQDIQQGNVITQEMVNELRPGMAKRQVLYVLGTPMLTDYFHQDRWDYPYTMKKPRKPMEERRLTVFFEDDRLVRVEGDLRPEPQPTTLQTPAEETVVSVPDWEPEKKTLFGRAMSAVGLGKNE